MESFIRGGPVFLLTFRFQAQVRNIISIVTPNEPFPRGQYTRNSFVRIVLQLICLTAGRLRCDSLHDLSMYIGFVLHKSENSNSIW